MVARVRDGNVGAHLYTPLVRADDIVLVNRGWVPVTLSTRRCARKAGPAGT